MDVNQFENISKGYLENLNGSKKLLVSFGGINQGLGIPVFEFFNSISDIDCDKIYLRDFNQAWYQKGIDSELDSIDRILDNLKNKLFHNNYQRVCFIGNSMGGYAAILFGTLLNVDRVVSFAPQSYIDYYNRLISLDRRWSTEISCVHKFEKKKKEYFDLKKYLKKNPNYKTEISLYYSINHRLDKKHSERLRYQKNIVLHPIEEGGHSVVKVLRNNGMLKSILKSTLVN